MWQRGAADEASSSVGVKSKHEGNEEVVSIPEGLERLLTDLGMSSGEHEQHTEEHEVTSDTTNFRIMDLQRRHRSNLGSFDIEHVDVVTKCVNNRPEEERVRDLSMEPLRLIERQPPQLGSDESQDVTAHR